MTDFCVSYHADLWPSDVAKICANFGSGLIFKSFVVGAWACGLWFELDFHLGFYVGFCVSFVSPTFTVQILKSVPVLTFFFREREVSGEREVYFAVSLTPPGRRGGDSRRRSAVPLLRCVFLVDACCSLPTLVALCGWISSVLMCTWFFLVLQFWLSCCWRDLEVVYLRWVHDLFDFCRVYI